MFALIEIHYKMVFNNSFEIIRTQWNPSLHQSNIQYFGSEPRADESKDGKERRLWGPAHQIKFCRSLM